LALNLGQFDLYVADQALSLSGPLALAFYKQERCLDCSQKKCVFGFNSVVSKKPSFTKKYLLYFSNKLFLIQYEKA